MIDKIYWISFVISEVLLVIGFLLEINDDIRLYFTKPKEERETRGKWFYILGLISGIISTFIFVVGMILRIDRLRKGDLSEVLLGNILLVTIVPLVIVVCFVLIRWVIRERRKKK